MERHVNIVLTLETFLEMRACKSMDSHLCTNYHAITFLDLKRRRIGLYEDIIICIRVLHLYLTTANVHVISNV